MGSKLPELKYRNVNTNVISRTILPTKKTLVIYFFPDCGSCDMVAKNIYDISKKNNNCNFVFITEETNNTKIKDYIRRNKINQITDHIYIDYKKSFQEDFGTGFTISIPTILYYNQEGNLVCEIKNVKELHKI
jgi:thiol-disulfide isomerase/thioredoxin